MEALLFVVAGLLLLVALAARGGDERRRASESEVASARAVAAARLRGYELEREERFRHYHAGWQTRHPKASTRSGYVLPFRAAGGCAMNERGTVEGA